MGGPTRFAVRDDRADAVTRVPLIDSRDRVAAIGDDVQRLDATGGIVQALEELCVVSVLRLACLKMLIANGAPTRIETATWL